MGSTRKVLLQLLHFIFQTAHDVQAQQFFTFISGLNVSLDGFCQLHSVRGLTWMPTHITAKQEDIVRFIQLSVRIQGLQHAKTTSRSFDVYLTFNLKLVIFAFPLDVFSALPLGFLSTIRYAWLFTVLSAFFLFQFVLLFLCTQAPHQIKWKRYTPLPKIDRITGTRPNEFGYFIYFFRIFLLARVQPAVGKKHLFQPIVLLE